MHPPRSAPGRRCQAGIGLLFALSSGALAASPLASNKDDLANLDLEQLVELPVTFVSGVSKYEQSVRQAPASVTVLTHDDIRNHGWRTLADALRSAPGFHIRNDRFYEYIGNRGYTRALDYNSRTLVLIDGHRINDPIYQQGSIGTDFLLDPDLIERIEIIHGPGSSVYGSSAFYGAINVIPKKGRDLAGGQASLTVDSTSGSKSRFSLGNRTAAGVEYLISGTYADHRGEDKHTLPDSWRAYTGSSATVARRQDGDEQKQLYTRVSWKGLESEAAYGSRRKDTLPEVYNTLEGSNANATDTRAYWLLRATGQPLPDATLTAKTSVDYYHYTGEFTPGVDTDDDGDADSFQRRKPKTTSLSLNHEIRWHQAFSSGHSLLFGVEVQNNLRLEGSNANLDDPASSAKVIDESSSYYSPFAQFDYQIDPSLRLSIGARDDNYSTGESRLTPRIGLIYNASAHTTLKLLYGESFRVPNIEERHPSEPGGVANPTLGPETNRSWELVAEHDFTNRHAVSLHIYRTKSNGLISYYEPSPSTYSYQNSATFETIGTELGLTSRFACGLSLRSSLTLQRTRDKKTDATVGDSPRVLYKLNASAPVYGNWLRASTELQYVGDRRDFSDPANHNGNYLVANASLLAAPVYQNWEIGLTLYNLANARWNDSTNSGQISAPRRTAALRITREF